MRLSETILVSVVFGTLALIVEMGTASRLDASDYVTLRTYFQTAITVWPIYLLIFVPLGMLAWFLTWVVARHRPFRRRLGTLATFAMFCIPVVNATLTARPSLERVLTAPRSLLAAALVLAMVLAWLVYSFKRGRWRVSTAVTFVLVLVSLGLAVANVFIILRLASQIMSPAGIGELTLFVLASWVLALPLIIYLWRARRSPLIRHLSATLGIYILVYASVLVFTPLGLRKSFSTGPRNGHRLPSILLIVIDTLRFDVVSRSTEAPGLTPNIASLASDGVWFGSARAPSSWTTPSFGALLTSTYPSQHHAGQRHPDFGFQYPLAGSAQTIAELLQNRGYRTGAILTNPQLGRRFGFDRGFDVYRCLMPVQRYHPIIMGLESRKVLPATRRAYIVAEEQTLRIQRLIEQSPDGGQPFFILAHYMDPHTPYDPPRIAANAPRPIENRFDRYRAEVAYCDEYVGSLLGHLKEVGLYKDLMIVLTADHGEEFYEGRLGAPPGKRLYDHGHTLFEELIHVPLVIKYPGNTHGGTTRDDNVSLIDLAPTMLDICDLPVPDQFLGRSLFQDDAAAGNRVLYSEGLMYGPEQKAAVVGSLKIVLDRLPPEEDNANVFDLSADPLEKKPSPLDLRRNRQSDLYASLAAFALAGESTPNDEAVQADPHVVQQLKSLGYIK